jgi:tRNA pseudouridine32 synthase/23S rRNA pseudouridine746 synthase
MLLADRILFIDAEALVLDKPSGLPVDAPRRGGDSIAARLGELKCGFKRPPTPMHRLDMDTSGCLLFAGLQRRARRSTGVRDGAVEGYYLGSSRPRLRRRGDRRTALKTSTPSGLEDDRGQAGLEATRWRAFTRGGSLVEFSR